MALTSADIEFRLSGGATNVNPATSLGGTVSTAAGGLLPLSGVLHSLFPPVTGDQATSGITQYRCIYIRNISAADAFVAPKIWIPSDSTSPSTELDIALGGEGVGGTAETVANETTAPVGEVFSHPTTKASGLASANVPFGSRFPLWLRWTTSAAAAPLDIDLVTITVEGS